ncbi:hypothetical protein PGB90_003448 [Kerria lacca]
MHDHSRINLTKNNDTPKAHDNDITETGKSNNSGFFVNFTLHGTRTYSSLVYKQKDKKTVHNFHLFPRLKFVAVLWICYGLIKRTSEILIRNIPDSFGHRTLWCKNRLFPKKIKQSKIRTNM